MVTSRSWPDFLEVRRERREIAQPGVFARVVGGFGRRPVRSGTRDGWSAGRYASFRRIAASSQAPRVKAGAHGPHPVSALRFAPLRAAACGRALVSCLASAVHASRRNRRADSQPPHEATSMNAQSTHPIRTSTTRTTDPQFLGPEAGQQAEGFEEPTYDQTATYSPAGRVTMLTARKSTPESSDQARPGSRRRCAWTTVRPAIGRSQRRRIGYSKCAWRHESLVVRDLRPDARSRNPQHVVENCK